MRHSFILILFLALVLAGCSNTYTVTRAKRIDNQTMTKEIGRGKKPPADNSSLSDGLILYRQGDASGAQKIFKAVLADNPGNWLAHYYFGLISYENQQYSQAFNALNEALKFGPDRGRERAMIYVILGQNWEEQGFNSKAYLSYHTALNIDKNSITARDGLKRTATRTERD